MNEEQIKELIEHDQKKSFLIGVMYGAFNELKEEAVWRDDQRIRVDDLLSNIQKMINELFYKDKTN